MWKNSSQSEKVLWREVSGGAMAGYVITHLTFRAVSYNLVVTAPSTGTSSSVFSSTAERFLLYLFPDIKPSTASRYQDLPCLPLPYPPQQQFRTPCRQFASFLLGTSPFCSPNHTSNSCSLAKISFSRASPLRSMTLHMLHIVNN